MAISQYQRQFLSLTLRLPLKQHGMLSFIGEGMSIFITPYCRKLSSFCQDLIEQLDGSNQSIMLNGCLFRLIAPYDCTLTNYQSFLIEIRVKHSCGFLLLDSDSLILF